MRVAGIGCWRSSGPTADSAWFDRGDADPLMTAIVLHGLQECDRLGWKVDQVSLKRGRDRLRAFAKGEADLDLLAYQAYVLGEEFDRLLAKKDELTAYSRALLALTLHRAGRAEAAEVVKALVASAKQDHWESPNRRRPWENASIETTAYALQALVAVDPAIRSSRSGGSGSCRSADGNRWQSTKDTAVAISTLLKITEPGPAGRGGRRRRQARGQGGVPQEDRRLAQRRRPSRDPGRPQQSDAEHVRGPLQPGAGGLQHAPLPGARRSSPTSSSMWRSPSGSSRPADGRGLAGRGGEGGVRPAARRPPAGRRGDGDGRGEGGVPGSST